MVKISISYAGELRCNATHELSGSKLSTDAPLDNNGKGETFSPSDLVATALGSCMATIMGIVAERKGISLESLSLTVEKHMSEDTPRRISKLSVTIHMPMAEDDKYKDLMINAALTCPVHQSLHPSIEVPIEWLWLTS
jgi:uncharacterized OsmC-like protein